MEFPLHSEQINEISSALSKAQGEIKSAEKDSVNPHFKAKFASLNSHWESCRDILSKYQLTVTQLATIDQNNKNILVTILSHSSGQWFKSYLQLNPVKNDPQGMGSCMSYARRYLLSAIVGTTADDDDAEEAMNRTREVYKEKQKLNITPLITLEQTVELTKILKGCEPEYKTRLWNVLKERGIMNLQQLPASDFDSMKAKCIANREKYQYTLISHKDENNEKQAYEVVA